MKLPRILYVDDETINLELLQLTFMEKFDVITAESAEEGLSLLALNPDIHVIISDLRMPVMNGLDAIKTLRNKGYTGSIVALTANAMQEDINNCKEAGSDGFLTKPIKWDKFFEVLKNSLPPGEKRNSNDIQPLKSTLIDDNPNMQNVVKQFIDYLPEKLEEIKNLYHDKDFTILKERLHTIKGTAGNFGFMDLTNVAASIEEDLKSKNFPGIEDHFSDFDHLYQRIKLGQ